MKVSTLSQLAFKHAQNAFQESVYIKSGLDITKPVKIFAIINERCNYKCRYCDYWRLKEYPDEMPIEQWQAGLQSLKDYVGTYHIEFSGGEPFLKKNFISLLEWCHENKINFGVTTNGSAFRDKIIKRFVATQPFNVNISVDSNLAEVHDYTRGIEGSFDHLVATIPKIRKEQERQGIYFPIIIKPTVTSANFRHLPEIARWATETLGGTIVNFQPIDRWTQETYDELWIEKEDHEELQSVVDELTQMKRDGAPIMNSVLTMNLWVRHFLEEKAPESAMPCRVGLRNYCIRSNGDVESCWYFPPIGNIQKQSAKEIWKSEEAVTRREETTNCERLCLFSCLSANSFTDKLKTGIKLLTEHNKTTNNKNW